MKSYQKLIEQKPAYWNYRLYAYRIAFKNYLIGLDDELGREINDKVKIQEAKDFIQSHLVMQHTLDEDIPNELVETYFKLGCQAAMKDFLSFLRDSLRSSEKIKAMQVYIQDYCQD